jgi:hypothetical protein
MHKVLRRYLSEYNDIKNSDEKDIYDKFVKKIIKGRNILPKKKLNFFLSNQILVLI